MSLVDIDPYTGPSNIGPEAKFNRVYYNLLQRQVNPLQPAAFDDLGRYLTVDLIPELSLGFWEHRSRIARLLPYIDSRNLDLQTRDRIGLPKDLSDVSKYTGRPKLFRLGEGRPGSRYSQYSDFELDLFNTFLMVNARPRLYPSLTEEPVALTILNNCMRAPVLKDEDGLTAVCCKTTEFSGHAFIFGIVYAARDEGLAAALRFVVANKDGKYEEGSNLTGLTARFLGEQKMIVNNLVGEWEAIRSIDLNSSLPKPHPFQGELL